MMRTPDGHGRVELTKVRHPERVGTEPAIAPPNTLGLRQIMFAVDDLDDTVARLQAHGAELVGEVVQYENLWEVSPVMLTSACALPRSCAFWSSSTSPRGWRRTRRR